MQRKIEIKLTIVIPDRIKLPLDEIADDLTTGLVQCQPYRNLDKDGQVVDKKLKDLARWCNIASVRKSCKFEDFKG